MGFPNRGEKGGGGGGPHLEKIPTFSRFFWETSLKKTGTHRWDPMYTEVQLKFKLLSPLLR